MTKSRTGPIEPEDPEKVAAGGPERPREPAPGTSDRAKSFKKHCLNCRKYSNHRHTPAEYNTPCILCPCKYFYGWENWSKKYKRPLKELRAGKPIETVDAPLR